MDTNRMELSTNELEMVNGGWRIVFCDEWFEWTGFLEEMYTKYGITHRFLDELLPRLDMGEFLKAVELWNTYVTATGD